MGIHYLSWSSLRNHLNILKGNNLLTLLVPAWQFLLHNSDHKKQSYSYLQKEVLRATGGFDRAGK